MRRLKGLPINLSHTRQQLSCCQYYISVLKIFFRRGVAQSGSAPALGAGGRKFESCLPDQTIQGVTAFAVSPFLFIVELVSFGYT